MAAEKSFSGKSSITDYDIDVDGVLSRHMGPDDAEKISPDQVTEVLKAIRETGEQPRQSTVSTLHNTFFLSNVYYLLTIKC